MQIAVIGGGFSGLALCWHLLNQGHKVALFEKKAIGAGASGIAAGLLHPYPGEQGRRSKYADEGLIATRRLLEVAKENLNRPLSKLALLGKIDDFCAAPQSNFENMCGHMVEKFDRGDAKNGNFNEQMEFRKRSNQKVANYDGILRCIHKEEDRSRWFDHIHKYGDVVHIQDDCFLIKSGITVFTSLYLQGLYQACIALGLHTFFKKVDSLSELKEYDRIVIAAGAGIMDFKECAHLKTKRVKGQVLTCQKNKNTPLQSKIAKGYIAIAESEDHFYLGSTYERQWITEDADLAVAKQQLLPKAQMLLGEMPLILECRAALRVMHAENYMPIAEQLTERCYVLSALGSRGLLYHAYFADMLAAKIGAQ